MTSLIMFVVGGIVGIAVVILAMIGFGKIVEAVEDLGRG